MTTFQTIVLAIFGFFIIAGLLLVGLTKGRGEATAPVVDIWGVASAAQMSKIKEKFFPERGQIRLSYTEVPEEALDQTLLEALASGRGPDAVILPAALLLRWRDKIIPIPFVTLSERDYKDAYIQEADLFLTPSGALALPFSLDPLVMYWNRDLLDAGGISSPPRFWDEFLLLANQLTARDSSGNISRSAVSLGEYRNIRHAREILAAMFIQSGNPIVAATPGGGLDVTLNSAGASGVLSFYTEFGNPAKPIYSWNRAMPESQSAFLASRSAIYFGLASELPQLKAGNPNLNFDVAAFPHPRNSAVSITYGKLAGVAVLRAAKNPSAALQAALILSSAPVSAALSETSGLPSVRRGLLSGKPAGAAGAVFSQSALPSRAFLDPNPAASDGIFQTMVESVTGGRTPAGEALSRADGELRSLLR